MTLTGIKTLPLLDKSLVETGPWSSLFARSGYRVYPFKMGALVRSVPVGTTVLTAGMGEFATNDYLMVCTATAFGDANLYIPNVAKVAKVTSNPSAETSEDQLVIAPALTIAAGDFLLNLGPDSGALTPNYDGSTLTLYTDNAGTAANSNKYLLTGTNGEFRGWLPSGTLVCDLLATNASGVPLIVIPFITLGAEVI